MKKTLQISYFLLFLISTLESKAQLNLRYTTNVKGDIIFVSNNNVTCGSGAAACTKTSTNYTYSGPESASFNNNSNNNYTSSTLTYFNDIDGDLTTFNSSSATYSLPATALCPDVLWAGLYWGAECTNAADITGVPAAYTSTLTFANINKVKFKTPTSGSYLNITADNIYSNGGTNHCFKDVTSIVQAAGLGTYTVANIVSRTTNNQKDGGWTLVIVYSDKNGVKRNLSVFDGMVAVTSTNNLVNVPISGFATPPTGTVGVRCGLVVYDGDRSSISDSLQFRGAGGSNFPNFVVLSDATHAANNVFNSTISNYGNNVTSRNPGDVNTIGYDASLFNVPNAGNANLGNSATSATLKFTTGSEAYRVGTVVTMIDIIDPELDLKKSVTDLNGGVAMPGDTLEYTVKVFNRGNDTSILSYIYDSIPFNTTYVASSLKINGISKSDGAGDDQAEFIAGTKIVQFRVGSNATSSAAGRIRIGDSVTVKFKVKITTDCAVLSCTNLISNRAYSTYSGFTSNANFAGASTPDLGATCTTGPTYTTITVPVTCSPPGDVNMLIVCPINFVTLSQAIIKDKDSVNVTSFYTSFYSDSLLTSPITSTTHITSPGTYYATRPISGSIPPCTDVVKIIVNQQPQFIAAVTSKTDALCNGDINGTANVNASGATSPYTYAWSNSQTTQSITNLAPATYTVTITDANLCTITSTVAIGQPAVLGLNLSSSVIVCPSDLGTITSIATGGVTPYQYSINNGAYQLSNTFLQGVGTYTVIVKDANNCTKSSTITLIFTDNIPPTVNCPANVVSSTSNNTCTKQLFNLDANATDNCNLTKVSWTATGATTASSPLSGINDISGQIFNKGVTTITYTATDTNNNSASCTFTVTINDNQDPVISCPPNMNVTTTPSACNASNVVLGIPVTSDNCSVFTTTNNAPTSFLVGLTTVTWTVTDNSGNTATCTQDVLVTDSEIPTITCPTNKVVNNTTGLCTGTVPNINLVATDNCGIQSITYSISGATNVNSPSTGINNASTVLFNIGTSLVTYVVEDIHGNVAVCTFEVTVNDNQKPTLTCPGNKVVAANNTCEATVGNIALASFSDNCGTPSVEFIISGATSISGTDNASGLIFNKGVSIVKYIVTDDTGNKDSCQFTVTVNDSTKPTLVCPPTQALYLNGTCSLVIPDYTAIISVIDNCSPSNTITVTQSPAAGTVVTGTGLLAVKLVATDQAGNKDSCSFNVQKINSNPPVLNCIGAQNLYLSVNCTASLPNYTPLISSSDICLGNAGVTVTQVPAAGFIVSGTGTQQVTFIATDTSGNIDSCSILVTKIDTIAPSIICPTAQTLYLNNSCNAVLPNYILQATAIDACTPSANITVTQVPLPGTIVSSTGNTTIILTATDASGNTASCSFEVNKLDTLKTTITCPPTVNASADPGQCEAVGVVLGTPTVNDNCGILTVSNNAPASYPVGTTLVSWTVEDINGNIATCTQNVIITDNEIPTISCPADLSLNSSPGVCGASSVALGTPVVQDNCGILSIVNNAPAIFPVGTTILTWTVTDIHNNVSTCTQTVTILDTENPVITSCPTAQTINAAPGQCSATVALGSPVATDNCSVATITSDAPATFPVGTTIVTWTITDSAGNSTTCSQSITVVDNQAPILTCPPSITINNDPTLCSATLGSIGTITASDNCGIANIINDAPSTFPVGTTAVTWTVTDIYGNVSTCTQDVVVVDNEAPIVVCTADTVLYGKGSSCEANMTPILPLVSDNCGIQSITSDKLGTVFSGGISTVTWTITDIHGNVSTCSQQIHVVCVDSVFVTPPCPYCPVTACPVINDVDTTGTPTFVSCGAPVGFAMTGPNAQGCYELTPTSITIDTVVTCIVTCNHGICDTTVVTIYPTIVPDTITVTPSCPTCALTPICPTADNLPTAGTITYANCGLDANESLQGSLVIDANGCATWTPNGIQKDTIKTCVIKIVDGKADTTYIIIPPVIFPDTIISPIPYCSTCPTVPICATGDQINVNSTTTYTSCGLSPTDAARGSLTLDVNGCLVWTPNGTQIDTVKSCVVACTNGICDTTFINFPPFSFPLNFSLSKFIIVAPNECTRQLNWITETEINSSHFELEKSKNGNGFAKIATIPASGNSSSRKQYTYMDIDLSDAAYQYRLKMIDIDGNSYYSSTIQTKVSCFENEIVIYPNPSVGDVNLVIRDMDYKTYTIKLIDMVGKTIYSSSLEVNKESKLIVIQTNALSCGTYSFVINDGIESKVIRFEKQ